MPTASQIVAGRAAVVIGVEDSPFRKGLRQSEAKLRTWGASVAATSASISASFRGGLASAGKASGRLAEAFGKAGGSLRSGGMSALTGAGMASLPLFGGLKAFASVETTLAELRAAANPTAAEFKKLQEYIAAVGSTPGIGQAELASAMMELVKAGMPLEKALAGAGLAAVKFAKVAKVSVEDAAIVATDMSNVFGGSVSTAMDILSQAADSSSVSLREVTLSMSMASAVAGMTGKGLRETATAIGIMGTAGLKGSDAGTALKTFLMRLAAPVEDGAKAMEEFGLNVRDSTGNLKPMTGIIAELEKKLGGLAPAAKDEALRRIFGADAIRPASILLKKGVAGWDEFSKRMADGLPVGSKWSILMDTMSGALAKMTTVVVNAGVAIGKALAPSIRRAGEAIMAAGQLVTYWIGQNESSIVTYGKVVLAVGAVGAVLWTLGSALKFVAFGFSGLKLAFTAASAVFGILQGVAGILFGALGALLSPIGLLVGAIAGLIGYAAYASGAFQGLADTASSTWADIGQTASDTLQGITDAIAAGDMAAAAAVAWAGLKVVFRQGYNWLHAGWLDFTSFFRRIWAEAVYSIAGIGPPVWAGMQSAWVQVASFFQSIWEGVVSGIKNAWGSAQNWIGKSWIRAMKALGVYDEETAAGALAILEEDRSKAAKADAQASAEKQSRIESEKQAKLAAIGKEETAALGALDAMRKEEQDRISASHTAALDADKKELADAKRNLADSTAKTKKAAEEKRQKETAEKDKQREDQTKKDAAAIADTAKAGEKATEKAKTSTVGTFSAGLAAMLAGSRGAPGVTAGGLSKEDKAGWTKYDQWAKKKNSSTKTQGEMAGRQFDQWAAGRNGAPGSPAAALDAAVAAGKPGLAAAGAIPMSAPAAAVSRAATAAPAAIAAAASGEVAPGGGRDPVSAGILSATSRSADLLSQILATLQTNGGGKTLRFT